MEIDPCECDKLRLGPTRMRQCRENPAYRAMFLARAGLLQDAESEGLGDTIAKLTKAIGIKPCDGCEKRRQALNSLFPYRDKAQAEVK